MVQNRTTKVAADQAGVCRMTNRPTKQNDTESLVKLIFYPFSHPVITLLEIF